MAHRIIHPECIEHTAAELSAFLSGIGRQQTIQLLLADCALKPAEHSRRNEPAQTRQTLAQNALHIYTEHFLIFHKANLRLFMLTDTKIPCFFIRFAS